MKERPILMSAPMVRACLRDQSPKTQTRRVVKPRPIDNPHGGPLISFNHGTAEYSFGLNDAGPHRGWWRCPYGQPGDLLWVREAWRSDVEDGPLKPRDIAKGRPIFYAAGGSKDAGSLAVACAGFRPSIHMPRWASRLTLRVTDVRIERLNEISEADALAEGIERIRHPEIGEWGWPQRKYRDLWEHINGAGSWDANPWVWVVSFERAQP